MPVDNLSSMRYKSKWRSFKYGVRDALGAERIDELDKLRRRISGS